MSSALARFRQQEANPESSLGHSDRLIDLFDAAHFNKGVTNALGVNYERLFFGLPITTALGTGLSVTARGYFDATESPIAVHTATVIRRLCRLPASDSRPRILDLFAGTGQMSWAFAREGFDVKTFEKDSLRLFAVLNNFNVSEVSQFVDIEHGDALESIKSFVADNIRFDAVYLDPPWAGKYRYDHNNAFRLSDMDPSGSELLDLAFKISDVVALKCPQNTSWQEFENLCREHCFSGKYEFQNIVGFPKEMNQSTAYFVRRRKSKNLFDFSISTASLSNETTRRGTSW